ncbi:dipeptidase [Aquidulcibacter paucihalophilus]|uniref:dipeptidase n=1 Tax=Aquidulcibacter paucihalophilus TaxID=1978549 RepID=UPI000A199326|nr:dipeptidase [Aquidulcibacter paucihalophilus]
MMRDRSFRQAKLTLISLSLGMLAFGPALAKTMPSERAARALHERILTLDTHLDTPAVVARPGFDILKHNDWKTAFAQVDVPRMKAGGLDGGFWVIYTAQGPRTPEGLNAARDAGLMRAVVIREMLARSPKVFGLALKADDAAKIAAEGKRVVFMSIENSYPLAKDVSLLETFYKLGVRMVGPVHFATNDWADSSTDKAEWGGLSPLGKQLVAEANRLGMILDQSHASDQVLDQMLELSSAPIIASHSGCKAIYDHPRNLDDDRLKALAAKGGVIQMNAFGAYLKPLPQSPERRAALAKLAAAYPNLASRSQAEQEAFRQARVRLDAAFPENRATFDDFMAHLLHAIRLIGVDHVGIGIDWDGGGGVVGLEDASKVWKITQALMAEGYSEEDIAKIWGGNVLRVMREVEAKAQK